MDGRKLGVGLAVLAIGLMLIAGTASSAVADTGESGVCQIKNAHNSFTAQGELSNEGSVADVIEVGCDPFEYGTGSTVTVVASTLYSMCGDNVNWYVPDPYGYNGEGSNGYEHSTGRSIELTLDADGNATVALIAGPHCADGGGMIAVHTDEEPFKSYTTEFTVLPPDDTTAGVETIPSAQVEDDTSSAFATIVETEFPGVSEQNVRVGSEELFHRCRISPHLDWVTEDNYVVEDASELNGETKDAIALDNDGNGFALVLGNSSCAPGPSLIEADLEAKPFSEAHTEFTIEAPTPRKENP